MKFVAFGCIVIVFGLLKIYFTCVTKTIPKVLVDHSFNFAIITTGLSVSLIPFSFCNSGGSWVAFSGLSSNQSFTS
jgi:hypothetical protein